jgi:DNA-binding NtrC family response regulator
MMKIEKIILLIGTKAPLYQLLKGVAAGYEVVVAEDGVSGLRVYEQYSGEVAAVITDLGAARLGGDLVADWIHRADPELPIIINGEASEASVESLLADAKVRFVNDSFDQHQLRLFMAESGWGLAQSASEKEPRGFCRTENR